MGDALKIVTVLLASMPCGIFAFCLIIYFLEDRNTYSRYHSRDWGTAFMVGYAISLGISIFIIIAAWIQNKVCLMIAFICAIVMAVVWFVFAIIGLIDDWGAPLIVSCVVFGGISIALAVITFFTGFKGK